MWFQMLLGHLFGDYLLQNEWMAMNKSKNTMMGATAAFVHCILYTFAVCLFMWNFQPNWILVVFFSHFPIDKYALAEKYMHYIKGKGMKDYVSKDKYVTVGNEKYETAFPHPKLNRYDMLEGGFTSIVYTLTDNSMHLIIMYLAYKFMYL